MCRRLPVLRVEGDRLWLGRSTCRERREGRGTPFDAWLRRCTPLCWGAENGCQIEETFLDSGVK